MIEAKQTRAQEPVAASPDRPAVIARAFDAPPDRPSSLSHLRAIADDPSAPGPVAPRQPLALYGAGNLGRLARDHLRAVGEDFALVVDRNAEALAQSGEWAGIRLVHPDAVDAETKARAMLAVSVVTSPNAPLHAALLATGWRDIVPFYDIAESFRDRHPLSNGWFAVPFSDDEVERIGSVLSAWDDDVSRAHHLQFIAWRRLRQEWTFDGAPVTIDDRFFIPQILGVLRPNERFLDAGAHHGSVVTRFIAETDGQFASILAVEPDEQSRAVLEQTLGGLPSDQRSRITVSDALLDSERCTVRFHHGLGYASQISPTGTSERETRTLDALGAAPSFVKLHLEGGELGALKGGIATLRKYRPIIAATVYHDADGLLATPAWLMDNLGGYRFLFRLHSWCGTGAVVYAIPEERQ
ncbi:MAG: FkbM family methyltransferase [Arenimonas sp.]|nr:FkbM family methyltransferase [Arenimonas sp.]